TRDYRPRAGVVRPVDEIFLAQHRGAGNYQGAGLQRAYIGRLPQRNSRQHEQDRVPAPDTDPAQEVRDAIGLRAQVGKSQARAPTLLVLPQQRNPVRVLRIMIDGGAEVEILRHQPARTMLACFGHWTGPRAAARGRGACERLAAALMYLTVTGERS